MRNVLSPQHPRGRKTMNHGYHDSSLGSRFCSLFTFMLGPMLLRSILLCKFHVSFQFIQKQSGNFENSHVNMQNDLAVALTARPSDL